MQRQAVHAQVRAASAHHLRPLSAHCTEVVPQMRQRALCDAAASGCGRMHALPRKRSLPCGMAHGEWGHNLGARDGCSDPSAATQTT
ncbi:hypothetical protein LMG920_12590 [Xanthomonas vesicatoria]|nr:hypothetical protein LMG920_12590 [Xanthomonas vesicatoria]